MMNPYSYLDSLKDNIDSNIKYCDQINPDILDIKIFSQREYLNNIAEFITSLRNIVDNSFFEIIATKYNGDIIKIKDFQCKYTEIEDIIFVQPLNCISDSQINDVMNKILHLNSNKSLNDKKILVIPNEVNFLKAKVNKL